MTIVFAILLITFFLLITFDFIDGVMRDSKMYAFIEIGSRTYVFGSRAAYERDMIADRERAMSAHPAGKARTIRA